jgi:TRAP-type transport system periplasmic protein
MRVPAPLSRRAMLRGLAGAGAFLSPMPLARAQSFRAAQYHAQPEDSHLQTYLTKIWDAVRRETGGRLDVTVYPRNRDVPFAEPRILKMVQTGELEFFVLNGNILSQAHPVADIQGIPFAFKSSAQISALNDGALGDLMRAELATAGIFLIPFGGMENGFKHITAVEKPIRSAADLENFRMRTPGGALFVDFYETLGATPKIVGLNELYKALSERQVDGQENPLVLVEERKLYEPCRYLSLSGHQWAGFNMIANNAFWQRLPEDLRDAVIRNTKLVVPEQRAFVQSCNRRLEQKLRDRGMIVNEVQTTSFKLKLTSTKFYPRWRRSVGEKAWRLMEQEVGPVG